MTEVVVTREMAEGRNLVELIERRAVETPDIVFLSERDRSLTFTEYRYWAERVAAGLAGLGVEAGTVVSWQLPTWLESMVLVGALARLDAVQNPILPILREREVGFITRQTGSRLLVVPKVWRDFDYEAMARSIAAEVDGLQVLVADRVLPEGDPSRLPAPPDPPEDPDVAPVRWIFYTSGTTADPKGAQHTDATVMAAALAALRALDVGPDDVAPMVFPFTHIGGITGLFQAFMVGARTVAVEAFDPSTIADVFVREGVTLGMAGTPFHLVYLAEHRRRPNEKLFAKVRCFPGGGAPKPPQLHYDIKAEIGGVGIVSGYGLTECPILSMNTVRDPDDKLAHTEGRAAPGVEIRVVTLDGNEAGPGEEGELRVRGPQLFKGYVDSSLDAEAFDADGLFRTGDLGYLDADGYVVITGRLKDIIIRKGENISAKEIEDLLYTHPKVADVAVVGLPDPALGERCCAVVASRDGDDPLSFDDMVSFLDGKGIARQKIPEQLELVEHLPRNPSGKILKHELRQRYAS